MRDHRVPDKTIKLSFVFHRAGEPVVDFRKPWNQAFKESKVARRLFHNLRRTRSETCFCGLGSLTSCSWPSSQYCSREGSTPPDRLRHACLWAKNA